jgi:tripartite-type tricarboxylate transporter receptor subunit TctC
MDVAAHTLVDYFQKAYGQRMFVENRGGAGGVLAGDAIAKAPPDGYTLGQIQVGNVAINPFLVKNMPFDPLNDLVPVAPLTSSPVVVAINARVPAANLADLVALARREPGKLNYGSAGPGTIRIFPASCSRKRPRVRLTVVHYRGAGPALTDLLAGQVQLNFVGLGVVRSHMARGNGARARGFAIRAPERRAADPDRREAGLPAFDINTWFGVVAPKGTPERVIATLVREIHGMQDDPSVRKRHRRKRPGRAQGVAGRVPRAHAARP